MDIGVLGAWQGQDMVIHHISFVPVGRIMRKIRAVRNHAVYGGVRKGLMEAWWMEKI